MTTNTEWFLSRPERDYESAKADYLAALGSAKRMIDEEIRNLTRTDEWRTGPGVCLVGNVTSTIANRHGYAFAEWEKLKFVNELKRFMTEDKE